MKTLLAALVFGALAAVCTAAPPAKERSAPEPESKPPPPAVKRLTASILAPLYTAQTAAGVSALANVAVTATATPTKAGVSGEVAFVPPLGPEGKAVLATVSKHLVAVHHGWPAGHRIELTFNPPIAPDDAPAGALALALVLDSMFTGKELDPRCAALGGLREDGKIWSVTLGLSRLTTAARGGASRIILPERNATQGADCMVNDGVVGFGRVQMFAVNDFEEAPPMAAAKPDKDFAAAISIFGDLQKEFDAAGVKSEGMLNTPDVQTALRLTLRKSPSHLSARLLLGHASKRYTVFSLPSSVEAVERIALTLLQGIHSATPHDVKKLPLERIADEAARLRRAVERVDPQSRPFLDAVLRYGEAAQTAHVSPPKTAAEQSKLTSTLSAAAGMAHDARQNLADALAALR